MFAMSVFQSLLAGSGLTLGLKRATNSCTASFLDTATVSKNEAMQDFTGLQIHCSCQHFQGLKHVRVALRGGDFDDDEEADDCDAYADD